MKIRVEVTQEDIDKGCRMDGIGREGGCMVWRALRRAIPGYDYMHVTHGTVVLRRGEKPLEELRFGPMTSRRIWAFDVGKPVKPFKFSIDIPPPV